jgi:hypothetical protein
VKNRFERREKAYRKFVKHVHYDQGHVSRPMFSSLFAPTKRGWFKILFEDNGGTNFIRAKRTSSLEKGEK